jgi:hypothetical protein
MEIGRPSARDFSRLGELPASRDPGWGEGLLTRHQALGLRETCAGLRITDVTREVYPPAVSDKPPQTYILHTVALFVVLITVMVVFLKQQWG